MSAAPNGESPLVATEDEAAAARKAVAKLKALAPAGAGVQVRVAGKRDVMPLPARAVDFMVQFLSAMAERQPVSIVPQAAELTTQEAADFLNVSRPYLVALLDKGDIPHRMVGTHRRVLASDLARYKTLSDEKRSSAIKRMVAEAQKLDLP